jgi:hypothetical protein
MDELEARARAQLDGLREVNEKLAAISVRETSPDDRVTAEVDGVGALTGLWFGPTAHAIGARELGDLVVATASTAAAHAFARRAVVLDDFNESFTELIASRPVAARPRSPIGTGPHSPAS